MKALGASEASSNAWCPSLHLGTWKDSSATTVLTPCWSVGPICFPSSSWARLTLLFKIIGLCFKQQPGWWSTGWGCGRPEFSTFLTLRRSIKHFPTLQKTVLSYEKSSGSGLLCYLSPVETVCSHTGMSSGQVPLQVSVASVYPLVSWHLSSYQ